MARPKKKIEDNRTVRREVKFTQQEHEDMIKKLNGMSFSDFIRKAALGVKPSVEKANSSQALLLKLRAVLARMASKLNEVGAEKAAVLKEEIKIMSELINEGMK